MSGAGQIIAFLWNCGVYSYCAPLPSASPCSFLPVNTRSCKAFQIAPAWKASDDVLQIPQQFRNDLEKLSHDAEVRDPEDGRIGVDRGTALVGRLRSKE